MGELPGFSFLIGASGFIISFFSPEDLGFALRISLRSFRGSAVRHHFFAPFLNTRCAQTPPKINHQNGVNQALNTVAKLAQVIAQILFFLRFLTHRFAASFKYFPTIDIITCFYYLKLFFCFFLTC
jgi:hypothetical protein